MYLKNAFISICECFPMLGETSSTRIKRIIEMSKSAQSWVWTVSSYIQSDNGLALVSGYLKGEQSL